MIIMVNKSERGSRGARMRRSLKIGGPLLVGSLATLSLTLVDTALLAHWSTDSLALMALVTPVYLVILAVLVPVGTAAQILVSQWQGAERYADIRSMLVWGTVATAILSVAAAGLLAALAPLASSALAPELAAEATVVLRILAAGLVCSSISAFLRGWMGGQSHTRPTMVASIGTNAFNIVADLGLIFVLGWGAIGAALSTSVASACGLGYLAITARRFARQINPTQTEPPFSRREARNRLAGIAWPDMTFGLVAYGADVAIVSIVSQLPLVAAAGYRLNAMMIAVMFTVAYAMSSAISIMVGQRVGAGQPGEARTDARAGGIVLLIWVAAVSLPILVVPGWFWRLFTEDPALLTQQIGLSWTFWLIAPAMIVAMTLAGTVRGTGDTKSMLYVGVGSEVIVAAPLCWLLGIHLGMGLAGILLAQTAAWFARCILTASRLRWGIAGRALAFSTSAGGARVPHEQ